MALQVGVNSYIDSAYADDYFADRYGYDLWAGESNKDGALVSAAQQLDTLCAWYGSRFDTDQPLEFPRDADGVPPEVKDAQCEIAYLIVEHGSASSTVSDALEEMKAGSVTMKFKATKTKNPFKTTLVMDILSGLGLCSGSIIPVARG